MFKDAHWFAIHGRNVWNAIPGYSRRIQCDSLNVPQALTTLPRELANTVEHSVKCDLSRNARFTPQPSLRVECRLRLGVKGLQRDNDSVAILSETSGQYPRYGRLVYASQRSPTIGRPRSWSSPNSKCVRRSRLRSSWTCDVVPSAVHRVAPPLRSPGSR